MSWTVETVVLLNGQDDQEHQQTAGVILTTVYSNDSPPLFLINVSLSVLIICQCPVRWYCSERKITLVKAVSEPTHAPQSGFHPFNLFWF